MTHVKYGIVWYRKAVLQSREPVSRNRHRNAQRNRRHSLKTGLGCETCFLGLRLLSLEICRICVWLGFRTKGKAIRPSQSGRWHLRGPRPGSAQAGLGCWDSLRIETRVGMSRVTSLCVCVCARVYFELPGSWVPSVLSSCLFGSSQPMVSA